MTSAPITTAQLAALYALRQAAPVLHLEAVMRGWWLVQADDGRSWLIDETGRTHASTDETSMNLCEESHVQEDVRRSIEDDNRAIKRAREHVREAESALVRAQKTVADLKAAAAHVAKDVAA